jgi:hypothetical protein
MFEHILKLFTEEPEKLKKSAIKFILLFITLLISLKAYQVFVGKYILLDVKNIKGLVDFFLSGKVLIALFVFLCCYYILQIVIDLVCKIMILLFKKAIGKIEFEPKIIEGILKLVHVLEYDENNNEIPSKGKNFDIALEVTEKLNDNVTLEEIRNQITFKYKEPIIATTLCYFIILSKETHNWYLSFAFLIVSIFILIFEYIVENLIEFVHKHAEQWKHGFEILDVTNSLRDYLNLNAKYMHWEFNTMPKQGFNLKKNNKEAKLIYMPTPLKNEGIQGLFYAISNLSERNFTFVVAIKIELYQALIDKYKNLPTNIYFISFENKMDLTIQLKTYLENT